LITESEKEVIFAQIKYQGELVKDGYLDARKAGEALLGIDESLRYFLYQESPRFQNIEIEIPVKVRKGSWDAVFLDNFDAILIKTAIAWGAGKYFGSALSEMAKKDFKDLGFKDVFKRAFRGMTWVFKIANHLETLGHKKIEKVKFADDNKSINLENTNGKILLVPIEYLELYSQCPSNLFHKLAKIVDIERELIVGYNENNVFTFQKVTNANKQIFILEEDEDVLFPELGHNDYVELEGHVTRGNENSNTIGFLYEGHILTCYPDVGNIKDYKSALFTNNLLKGYIDRLDKKTGDFIEKRPRIRFIEIVSKDNNKYQTKLL
jgi:hypothetical protein